jgi:RNA polymerase sigma-70 factor (ECF subfamily)
MNPISTELIWKDFSSQLRKFILGRVSNPDDAEDILQEIYIKIHTHLHQLENHERLAPWLYQIARNTIIDHYRSAHDILPLLDSIPTANEQNRLIQNDSATEIASGLSVMINRLPEKYRQAVYLSEIQGLPQKMLAEHTGLSLSGAKSRVQRGREILKRDLLNCCHFEFDRYHHIIDYIPKQSCCDHC